MAQHWNGQQQPGGFVPPQGYDPGQSQPYAQTYAPPEQPLPQNGYAEKGDGEYERFKPKKRLHDPIFLILFIAQLAGFAVVSGLALNTWISEGGLGGGVGSGTTGNSITLNRHTAYLLLLVTAAAVVVSVFYLMLVRAFTSIIMKVTLVLAILLNIGFAIYLWILRFYSGAIVFTIIAVFSVLAFWGFWSRIPLATLLLQVVMDVANHHKSVYLVAFLGLLVQAALAV
ncbi:putative choline transporter, neither null mutation nor overexpression affects choline transport, partial [Tulasnella sp. 418]